MFHTVFQSLIIEQLHYIATCANMLRVWLQVCLVLSLLDLDEDTINHRALEQNDSKRVLLTETVIAQLAIAADHNRCIFLERLEALKNSYGLSWLEVLSEVPEIMIVSKKTFGKSIQGPFVRTPVVLCPKAIHLYAIRMREAIAGDDMLEFWGDDADQQHGHLRSLLLRNDTRI